ncbi:MAG: hypothetical protein SCALA702_24910 [Melioribacteraceae bacterium]|nr:MAG: hypothetical protein SCALA702_24910 [Melioribacteraceae bacterium]
MRYLLILGLIFMFTGCKNSDPVTSEGIESIVVGQNIIHTHHPTSDGYRINSVSQREGSLVLNVSYGGGCQYHNFRLMADEGILRTMPPGIRAFLFHNDNEDTCEAWITDDIVFDLNEVINKVEGLEGRTEFSIHIVSPDKIDSTEVIVEINTLID